VLVAGALVFAPALAAAAELDEIFDRLSAVASAYPGEKLTLRCKETLRWRYFHEGGRTRWADQAIYDYSVSRDAAGEILEQRSTASNRKTRLELVEQPFFWLRFFEGDAAAVYRFELRGEQEFQGRSALRIDFIPRPERPRRDADEWHASLWVDAETLELLYARGIRAGAYEALQRMLGSTEEPPLAVEERTFLLERVSTTFGIAAEVPIAIGGESRLVAIRFPSEAELESSRQIVKLNGKKKRPSVLTLVKHEYEECSWPALDERPGESR